MHFFLLPNCECSVASCLVITYAFSTTINFTLKMSQKKIPFLKKKKKNGGVAVADVLD